MDTERPVDHEQLTEREQEILILIAEGLSNQQIADQLFLTLGTVKWYNKQIFQKLGVHSRTQAIIRNRDWDLIKETASTATHNLPVQDTVFVGRVHVLQDIYARLEDPSCRLLTLFGPGGIGKTRLAVEAARQQLKAFPDGVIFVPFAPVESPEFIAQALVDRLGLLQTSQRVPLEKVINYLREKRLLMVIDNFEHLLAGVDQLENILDGSKHVKMLVTSRERLRLQGEWVFDVQGLTFPAIGSQAQEQIDLADYEAGALFLQTARRVQSDFHPVDSDKAHISRICQLLEGMPLGIELAASWVRLLPCAEIASEISHGLDILTTTWRNVPERHRSIRAVLDHSWKLVTTSERDAFCKLTVLNSSFGRRAAEAVADASLLILLALVDKSFLKRVDEDHYGFHELVKQYGSDKLRADPEMLTTTRLRHCRFHAAFLIERMSSTDANSHLGEIEKVFSDIQSAWRYGIENKQLAEIQQLAEGFLVYYRLHSWYRAGSDSLALYQQALACFDPDTENPSHQATLACLYESLGNLHGLATAHELAIAAYERALGNTADNDSIRRGRIYGKIADTQVAMNQHEQGEKYYGLAELVLEQAHQRDEDWWVEWFRIQLQRMELFYWQNRPGDMIELANRTGPLIDQRGSVTQRLRHLYLLGLMALRRDRYFYSSEAIAFTGEALALSLETGNLNDIAAIHFSHGFSHLWSDHFDEAEKHLQSTRKMAEESGDLALLTRALVYLTLIYRRRGNNERVREYAVYTIQIAEQAKMPQYAGMIHAHDAWLSWRAGDMVKTKSQAQRAIVDWGGLGTAQSMVPFRWFALFPLIGVALQEEELEQAVQWAKHAITPFQQRLPDDLTNLLENAVTAWEKGQQDATNRLLHQAFQQAQELNYV